MTQAEIAGGKVTPLNELPSEGYRLHDFELPSTLSKTIRLSDYRGRLNLVLVFAADGSRTTNLLLELAREYEHIKSEAAEVLVVVQRPLERAVELKDELDLPYPVLTDEDGHIHRGLRACNSEGRGMPTVYVTDQFGEVFGVYRTLENEPLPESSEILKWLEFVNSQCPECEPPEWAP